MAPIDTPGIAERFIEHWYPDLAVFAEGEIWPNLLRAAHKSGSRLALVNARMTAQSLKGWRRWQATAQKTFGVFDVILAADQNTSHGLSDLLGQQIESPGNLKTALLAPTADKDELETLSQTFTGSRKCVVAASTHAGEEQLILDVWQSLEPRPALVVVPRHPERSSEIADLLRQRSISFARRSAGETPGTHSDVLLADTLGEMGLWYRLAHAVYLGGGHTEGVGGHNPLEPVRLGKSVVSGPDIFNFADVFQALDAIGVVTLAETQNDVSTALSSILEGSAAPADRAALDAYFQVAEAPLDATLSALEPLLPGVAKQ